MRSNTWLSASVIALTATAAHAQSAATVRSVVRVVKAGRATSPALFDAKIGTSLASGDRVRTAGRSAAGLRLSDQSQLRLGELTEVVMTGGKAQVLRGQVVADFKRPSTISSDYAVAAVRGTIVHYLVDRDRKQAEVRCYEGRVFVSAADNPISAGTTSNVSATQLTDPALQGSVTDWTGAHVQFVDGPYNGQNRAISAFNAGTGTITFAPALPAPAPGAGGVSGYLLIAKPDRGIVELRNNMGTTVAQGKDPSAAYAVPSQAFAMLQENPFFRQLADGYALYVYPNTDDYDQMRRDDFAVRDAIDRTTRRPRIIDCGIPHDGGEGGATTPRDHCEFGVRAAMAKEFAQATPTPAPTREERLLPANSLPFADSADNRNTAFRFEPFAIGSDETNSVGARVRFQGVSGDVYAEAGYRYALTDGNSRHDVSEAYVHMRGRYGDVIVGRQHIFPSPANNSDIGTLLGLDTADAVIYEAPLKKGYKQQIGYVSDSLALRRGGTRGAYARGRAPLWRGNVGYSVLGSTENGTRVGWSVDSAQSVIRNVLDIYGEAGVGVRGRELYTAGLYVPALYHAARVDVFMEYAHREGQEERISMRLRRELGSGLLLVGFIDQSLKDSYFTAGGGVLYSHRFK